MFGETDNVDFQPAASTEFATPPTIPTVVSEQPVEKPAKVNKSQAVRDYDTANPGKASAEVVAGLAAQGIEVTKALVDNTRWYDKMKAAKANPKKGVKKAAKKGGKKATKVAVSRPAAKKSSPQLPKPPARVIGDLTVADLYKFRTLINALGGIAIAKQAIEALEELRT